MSWSLSQQPQEVEADFFWFCGLRAQCGAWVTANSPSVCSSRASELTGGSWWGSKTAL